MDQCDERGTIRLGVIDSGKEGWSTSRVVEG